MTRCKALLLCFFAFFLAFSFAEISPAFAASKTQPAKAKQTVKTKQISKNKTRLKKQYSRRAAPPTADRFSALVVDADTGSVLYEKNAGAMRYPASLTKMMTLYLTFDALKTGKITLDRQLSVSAKAASQPQTNINLREGGSISVKDAIGSLVTRSANDASMVLAEGIGNTQWNFVLMMNQKARELGMKDTVFKNPNGLPDNGQYTNAYDMARLGIALRRDFPNYYPYFKLSRFDYQGVTYTTHNRVMLRYNGVDGIKTGYIRASGFNLVTSVKKDGHNLVAVIMGGSSATVRDDMMINMLDRTFAQLEQKGSSLAGGRHSELTIPPQASIALSEAGKGTF